jgi:hypothetical protein
MIEGRGLVKRYGSTMAVMELTRESVEYQAAGVTR